MRIKNLESIMQTCLNSCNFNKKNPREVLHNDPQLSMFQGSFTLLRTLEHQTYFLFLANKIWNDMHSLKKKMARSKLYSLIRNVVFKIKL